MGLKKNFVYNSILTLASYISTLLVFPYVSRVLGVDNIGIVNYVDNIVNYFIMLSCLGIGTVGVREIASSRNDSKKLSIVFLSLCKVLIITTFIAMIVLTLSFLFVPKLADYSHFLGVGLFKLFFSIFLIDWFYIGLEQFDYVAKRTVAVKALYVVLVFIFVHKETDYLYYYGITTFSIVLNSIINWRKVRTYVFFSVKKLQSRVFLKPMVSLGAYTILNSLYSTFNVLYLGWISGTREVAYYTTAFNVYLIISGFFTAFTGVMIPRMSSLFSENKMDSFTSTIKKSCNVIVTFCLPITLYCICEASNIIKVLTGSGFEGAIFPMQLINVLICVNGLSQIVVLQVLLPMKKDRIILYGAIMAAIMALVLDVLIVKDLGALGSAIVLISSVILSNLLPWCYTLKNKLVNFDVKYSLFQLILSLPYIIICMICNNFITNPFISLSITAVVSFLFFVLIQLIVIKNVIVIELLPFSLKCIFIRDNSTDGI